RTVDIKTQFVKDVLPPRMITIRVVLSGRKNRFIDACATAKRRTTVVITEVRIKLMEDNNERLPAFCSITFDDCFVIRDLKIIEGTKGSFVAMPSRKLTDRSPQCGSKNHLRARHCNQCGNRLD